MITIRAYGLRVLLAGAAALFMAGAAQAAGDASKEAATAAAHAGMAAGANDINMVKAHLHHAVNCLVGPKGSGYDEKQMDPCKGQGDGAITDASDATAKKKYADAVAKAQAGLKSDDLATAQKAAADVQTDLK